MQLEGKVAIATGGGRGIGRAICLALAEAGADVLVADIDLRAAEAVAAEVSGIGRRGVAFHADVTDKASVQAIINACLTQLSPVNGLNI
jgi:NAD(P)-dependent dehydrogenase (short-subunit alcohol dehydrogenase family)